MEIALQQFHQYWRIVLLLLDAIGSFPIGQLALLNAAVEQ
jgi:hypothetical protein